VDNGVHSSSPLQKTTSFKRVSGAVVLRAISTSSTAIVHCVGAKHAVVHPQTERSSLEKSKPFREEYWPCKGKVGAWQSYVSSLPNTTKTSGNTELPGIREHLNAAMTAKKQVFMSYNGGMNGDCPRKITPLSWLLEKEGRMESFATPVKLPTSVEEWLKGFQLERYWSDFDRNGYDTLETLEFNEMALDILKVTRPWWAIDLYYWKSWRITIINFITFLLQIELVRNI
jgi:hypothetical protein